MGKTTAEQECSHVVKYGIRLLLLGIPPKLILSRDPAERSGLQKADETIAARRGYTLCLGALPLHAKRPVLEALRREALGQDLPGGVLATGGQAKLHLKWMQRPTSAILFDERICLSNHVVKCSMKLQI